MSVLIDKISRYSKMIEAACGSAAMFGTMLLSQDGMLPGQMPKYLTAAIGVFTVFRVWLVKNEPLIEELVGEGEDLYHDAYDHIHPAPIPAPPAPTPAPDVPAPAPETSMMAGHDMPTEAFELPGRHERRR